MPYTGYAEITKAARTTASREEAEWHARRMADAIQAFRNLPMLGRMGSLRATPEYGALCEAWRDYDNVTDL